MQITKSCQTYPYAITVPATSLIVALGSTGLDLGAGGVIGGATLGLTWSIVLGLVVERRLTSGRWKRPLGNGSVFLAIVATGVMLGGGVMYALLMGAAAGAPSTVLSAMMQPTIPFFIVLNTPLELLVVPGAVFANWQNARRRRLIVVAAAAYYALRVWTYLLYVPNRMEIASRPLTGADLEWFQQSLSVDYRPILVAVVLIAFTLAAFVPDPPSGVTPSQPAASQGSGRNSSGTPV